MHSAMLGLVGSLLLTGVVTVALAGDFEGVILLRETSDGTTTHQQWFLNGDKLRFEEAGPDAEKGAMIFDAKKKVMFSIQHDEKVCLLMSADEASK